MWCTEVAKVRVKERLGRDAIVAKTNQFKVPVSQAPSCLIILALN